MTAEAHGTRGTNVLQKILCTLCGKPFQKRTKGFNKLCSKDCQQIARNQRRRNRYAQNPARKITNQKWASNNVAKVRVSRKLWRVNNKTKYRASENKRRAKKSAEDQTYREKAIQRTSQWRENFPERYQENSKNWNANNPNRVRKIKKDWKARNPEKVRYGYSIEFQINSLLKRADQLELELKTA